MHRNDMQSLMTMKPEVTVIIPTYKPQAYLYECLDSVFSQTLDKDMFEVVVVLNGCNEPYRSGVAQWIGRHGDLQARLLQTDTPGVSNARNIGIENARGANICFIDDDDRVSRGYLEALKEEIKSPDCMAVADVRNFDEDGNVSGDDYIARAYRRFYGRKTAPLLSGRSFLSSSCCKMIPRTMIGGHRFDCRFRIGEDSLFMASITDGLKTIRIAGDAAVYFRRVRMESASRSRKSRAFLVGNMFRTWGAYARIYLSDPARYNLVFFMTRIAAVAMSHIGKMK